MLVVTTPQVPKESRMDVHKNARLTFSCSVSLAERIHEVIVTGKELNRSQLIDMMLDCSLSGLRTVVLSARVSGLGILMASNFSGFNNAP
jgi:hypothetical protein